MMRAFLQDFDISPLVPEEYAAYRPLVAETMVFFLEHLSPPRLLEILAAQNRLPAEASLVQRLGALLHLCPTLHKLGQLLARNQRLAPALRERLQTLESMEPVTPLFSVIPTIERGLGSDIFSGIRLAPRPLAEASVAVVVPFSSRFPEEANPSGEQGGVLKVLKPGIEERLEEELDIWSAVSVFLDERCKELGLASLHYAETLGAVRELLFNEVKLDQEQRNLAIAGRLYAGRESTQIPSLLPFSTPRITAMERIFGAKVTQVHALSEDARKDLAKTIIDTLVVRPACSGEHAAMFHADPHAGNLFITEAGRLAVLDWSLVGYLGKRERELLAQLVLGAMTFDISRIVRAIEGLASSRPDHALVWKIAERALRRLHPYKFPGFDWLLKLLDDAKLLAEVRFPRDLLLFRKSVLTLEGVVADICANCHIGKVLPISAIHEFLHELLDRSTCSPLSRSFGTHVSNLDLLGLYWSLPMGIGRRWFDLLESRFTSERSS
uniref:Ubiquinone biosynthesis protein n=1 Tax=Candidatus Kentrum sp. LPFa TaxID=2126335 RepID=A0A450XGS0_9GAMM|nr:MAG: ubiquinone biosynthesis protein [Candidatus Kentron sp. LPFa]VFK28466.1 MAG: ubiquinone biosynthesis protein [Candidatus Kentron sp. LPFa]